MEHKLTLRLMAPPVTHIGKTEHYNSDFTLIWNRTEPDRIEGKYQICGHNSHWGLRRFADEKGEYAICIDTSAQKILTGIHWPSMQIYQQEYID